MPTRRVKCLSYYERRSVCAYNMVAGDNDDTKALIFTVQGLGIVVFGLIVVFHFLTARAKNAR